MTGEPSEADQFPWGEAWSLIPLFFSKWFEPRSLFMRCCMIVCFSVVLRRTWFCLLMFRQPVQKSFQGPLHKQIIIIKWRFALSEKETFYSIIYPYLNTFFIAVPNQTSGEQREWPARVRPVFSLCKKPMRGHSAIWDCPRNNKE